MLKDKQYCSYNGGGDASPLQTLSEFSSVQYDVGTVKMLVNHRLRSIHYWMKDIHMVPM